MENKRITRDRENLSVKLDVYISSLKKFIGFKKFFFILFLNTVGSIAEAIGIVMVIPLLASMDVYFDQGKSQDELVLWINSLLSGSTPLLLVGIISLFFIFKAVLVFAAKVNVVTIRANIAISLKENLLQKYGEMSLPYFSEKHPGYFINILNKQTAGLMSSLISSIDFAAKLLLALIYLIFAMMISPGFALMALFMGSSIFFLFRHVNNLIRETSRVSASEGGNLSKLTIQSIQAFKYLKATGQSKKPKIKILESLAILNKMTIRSGVFTNLAGVLKEPLSVVVISGIFYYQTQVANQPVAPILVSIILFHRGVSALFGIQQSWQAILASIGSAELYISELERQENRKEKNGGTLLGSAFESIEFKGVDFKYAESNSLQLKNISFRIERGQHVAFVGPSGCGKSTLLDLITLLQGCSSGEILINGVDSLRVHRETWRSKIGFVTQEPVIFNDTLLNNITMWESVKAVDYDKLLSVIDSAGLAEFVEGLPGGYESPLGDRGSRVSGGQKQRIAIARELYRGPELLILDEATSALDNASENHFRRIISRLKNEMTVITVAHRFSTVENADVIFVLDGGEIVERGTYPDLEVQSGAFANLINPKHNSAT